MLEIKNFINGVWVDSHKTVDNINPANTNDVINQAAEGNAADIDSAVRAASNAFATWRDTTPQVRHDLLDAIGNAILDRKEEFGTVLAREEGKTLPEAIGETVRAGHRRRSCARPLTPYQTGRPAREWPTASRY